jgi:hypothetical protein
MRKSDKMRALMASLANKKVEVKPKKKKAAKKKKKQEVDADVNKDGVVDEKDVSIVKEAVKKIKKKIVKKKKKD